MANTEKITNEQRVWGAISYVWVLSLVALVAKKDDKFIRGHANQGILLFFVSLIFMLMPPLNLLVAIVAIVGIVKALQGDDWTIPVVGDIAKKFGDWVIDTIKL